ncbi:hypothetical protein SSPNP10_13745 [Streptomyces sp. NP10]|nr:hypothetical protein SSPNP10_13745 [Streptomyces sp. NP10]
MVRRLAVVFFTAFLAVFFAAVFFAGAGSAVFLAGVRLAAARFGDAASAAASSVSAPAFDRVPELDSRWARTNHWNCSRPRRCSMSRSSVTGSISPAFSTASRWSSMIPV